MLAILARRSVGHLICTFTWLQFLREFRTTKARPGITLVPYQIRLLEELQEAVQRRGRWKLLKSMVRCEKSARSTPIFQFLDPPAPPLTSLYRCTRFDVSWFREPCFLPSLGFACPLRVFIAMHPAFHAKASAHRRCRGVVAVWNEMCLGRCPKVNSIRTEITAPDGEKLA